MMSEPKRCPFCDGKAKTVRASQREDGRWYPARCGCPKCDIWMYGDSSYRTKGFAVESDYEESMEKAILRWNRRANV